MVLGIDLVGGAGLVEVNAIHHLEVIPSNEGTSVLKVQRLEMSVGYFTLGFLVLWSKPYPKFSLETFCLVV